jgi:hypothetical protein
VQSIHKNSTQRLSPALQQVEDDLNAALAGVFGPAAKTATEPDLQLVTDLLVIGTGFPESAVPDGHLRCVLCGHMFAGPSAFDAHRNAYPLGHPLRRCLDGMELQALGYERQEGGSWAITSVTDAHPGAARRLATMRSQFEHWDATDEVVAQERMAAAHGRVKLRGMVQAVAAARRRQRDRIWRSRLRQKSRRETPPPALPSGRRQTPLQLTDSKGRKTRLLREPRSPAGRHP